jgi:hypothetical protein
MGRRSLRTSVSVSPELRARMDAVQEPVNWSAIACQAFEHKLAEITKRKGAKDMKDVINRLRASKEQFKGDQHQAGHDAGESWAKNEAEAGDLIQLDNFRGRAGTDWDACFWDMPNDAYSTAEKFFFSVWPEHDGERSEANEFWERQGFEKDHPVGDYVRGFAEGALSVWDDVKDEL